MSSMAMLLQAHDYEDDRSVVDSHGESGNESNKKLPGINKNRKRSELEERGNQ